MFQLLYSNSAIHNKKNQRIRTSKIRKHITNSKQSFQGKPGSLKENMITHWQEFTKKSVERLYVDC